MGIAVITKCISPLVPFYLLCQADPVNPSTLLPRIATRTRISRAIEGITPYDPGHPQDRCSESKGSCKRSKSAIRAAVPDLHGVRFCRVCEDFLPIAEFPRGQRRYTCRAHHKSLWERTGRKAKKTLLMKPRKKLLSRMWMQCYKDRAVFGQARVELTQADIDTLLDSMDSMDSNPCMPCMPCMHKPIDVRRGLEPAEAAHAARGAVALTVLPKDPSKPLSADNARLASKEARHELLALMLRRENRC